jgi:glycosyltransferase involved in cell wall biosynthesis
MRVLFVAPNLEVGGAERQWSVLIPGLIGHGVAAEVVTLDGRGRYFDEIASQGIHARYMGVHGRLPVRATMRAARAIADRRPDIVVSQLVSAFVVSHFASRRLDIPHVPTLHRDAMHPLARRQKAILRVLAPRVSVYTAVTHAQLPHLASLGFEREAAHVIPPGVDATEAVRPRDAVRAELGVAQDAFLALLVAALRPEKRADRFVEATAHAARQNPRIAGVVVGGGPDLDSIQARCAETGSAVRAVGSRADVPDLVNAADVVCLTSDAEALPSALLEGMAAGKPVVSTDVGGVRDAVVDGQTGILVPPGDVAGLAAALLHLAADPELASRLGAAGRRRHREGFTIERMVDAHLQLFEQLAPKRTASRGSNRKSRAS